MRVLAIVWVIFVAIGCSPKRTDAPAPAIDPTRMSHERHASIPCQKCHARDGIRPGAEDHQPCDDGICHRKEFLAPPSLFCQVCHTAVTTQPFAAPLKPYPSKDSWQAQPPRFSHKLHLDRGRVEARVGFHVECLDCHPRTGPGDSLVPPDHATCARCHASEAGLTRAPVMDNCVLCHAAGSQPRRQKTLIKNDLKPFDHTRHRIDRKGGAIKCAECHAQTAQATDSRNHPPPVIESCVTCHDDQDRTPNEARMRVCEGCHFDRAASLTSIAPRSHLPLTEKPLDHTIAFRRDHAEAANHSASRCATCHTQMSGNPAQACDECHQTMKPADHRITFRELDHGPDAVADRDRCASCHVVEFCTACHSQRPRSHGFNFLVNHGELAKVNIRPCLTCHGENVSKSGGIDCTECHNTGGSLRGGARPGTVMPGGGSRRW